MHLLFALLITIFSGKAAQASHLPNDLLLFLRGTTWCLQDADGPWDHGRYTFNRNGTGLYDVYDAPGAGGIPFTWETWEEFGGRRAVVIRYSKGFKPKKQFGEVLILDRNEIVFTWSTAGGYVSFANRCSR